MSEEHPDGPVIPEAKVVPGVISYATPGSSGRLAVVGRFGSTDEAEVMAAALAAEGIPARVLNGNASAMSYLPNPLWIDVEVHVHEEDAARAAEVLRRANSDDWEPAENTEISPPPLDDEGVPLTLVEAARFDSARTMREAQTALASARVSSFLPPLVPRGDRPEGSGDRFILRVGEEDLPRARKVLAEEPEEDEGDLRCPKCKSWRVYPVSHFWQGLASVVGLAAKPQDLVDCLGCKYRGPRGEFEAR